MDRKGKRLAALLCAVLMAVTLLPGQVWAEMYSAEDAPLSATVVCSNPLYPELGVVESVTYDADRKSTRLNSSHSGQSRMPSSA